MKFIFKYKSIVLTEIGRYKSIGKENLNNLVNVKPHYRHNLSRHILLFTVWGRILHSGTLLFFILVIN